MMILKRIFDLLFSIAGVIILLPLFIIISTMIMIEGKGPVIFVQIRTGRNGKGFKIYKFRTMIIHTPGNTLTIKGDVRITKVGVILRKYKLDELPELFNIIKGDMSFVGPRPDTAEYTDKLTGHERLILDLRPGITGLATLKYHNEELILSTLSDPEKYYNNVIWPDKVKINLEYYYNRNFLIDLNILFKTLTKLFINK